MRHSPAGIPPLNHFSGVAAFDPMALDIQWRKSDERCSLSSSEKLYSVCILEEMELKISESETAWRTDRRPYEWNENHFVFTKWMVPHSPRSGRFEGRFLSLGSDIDNFISLSILLFALPWAATVFSGFHVAVLDRFAIVLSLSPWMG
jgi:hypothetical protein